MHIHEHNYGLDGARELLGRWLRYTGRTSMFPVLYFLEARLRI